ncbi:hypothetical protein FNF31_06544 [Cafeteria roenbergensis]|nr:hypothetical protein FNF31_06544 [Cafeteria roenbergensis]
MAQQLVRQASASQVASVLGTFAPGLGPAASAGEEMFDCSICYMTQPISNRFKPYSSCEHDADAETCRECYKNAVTFEVENGKVLPGVKCCVDGCPTVLTTEQVRDLVTAATFAKYERFQLNADDATVRECGHCGENQPGDPDRPIMTCRKCARKFCYFHATAHEPNEAACKAYHRSHRGEDTRNRALLDSSAAACPRCKVVTTKSSGCNHMTCRCGAEWCWLCGMDITGAHGWHYMQSNPSGCPGMMMTEGAKPNSRRAAVMAAIAEQGTAVGRAKNVLRGLLQLLRLPFDLLLFAVVVSVLVAAMIVVLPCVCLSCLCVFPSADADGRKPFFIYFTVLLGSICMIPLLLLSIVLVRLRDAAFLILLCSTPPPAVAPPEGAPGAASRAEPKFGSLGGAGLGDEDERFQDAPEGAATAARPAAAASAAGHSAHAGGAANAV